MPSDEAIAWLAGRQHGNVAAWQLRELGYSREAIRHRGATGRLIRRFRGVFAWGYLRDDLLSRAAAAFLAAGPRAALTGSSSAGVYGVLEDPPGPIHLVRPTSADRRQGLIVHKGDPGETWERHHLPLTSPPRTLLDLAESQPDVVVIRVYNEMQVKRLITAAGLAAALPRWNGRKGVAVLKRMVGEQGGPTRSALEDRFLELIRAAGLPPPRLNAAVKGMEVDAVWPEQRVVVELDGRRFHDTDSRYESDRARDARLIAAGFVVLRFTWRRLMKEPYAVVAELAAALTQRAAA